MPSRAEQVEAEAARARRSAEERERCVLLSRKSRDDALALAKSFADIQVSLTSVRQDAKPIADSFVSVSNCARLCRLENDDGVNAWNDCRF